MRGTVRLGEWKVSGTPKVREEGYKWKSSENPMGVLGHGGWDKEAAIREAQSPCKAPLGTVNPQSCPPPIVLPDPMANGSS